MSTVCRVVIRPAALPSTGAVDSVNGQTGVVVLNANDVGAYPDNNPSSFIDSAGAPVQSVNGQTGVVVLTTYVIRTTTSAYVLPNATTTAGREYVVKAVNATVTITTGGGLIDGQATLIVSGTNSATLYSDGTNYFII